MFCKGQDVLPFYPWKYPPLSLSAYLYLYLYLYLEWNIIIEWNIYNTYYLEWNIYYRYILLYIKII